MVWWFDFVATCVQRHMCGILRSLSVVSGARRSPCSSAARLAWPLHLGIPSGRQYTFGRLLRLGMMVRGRGPRSLPCQQLPLGEQAAAGPSVQASWLGSLESRAWRGRWRRGGMKRTCWRERGVRGWLTKRCLLSFKPPPSWEYSIISLVASFELSKNTEKFRPELQYSVAQKQCQDQKYARICFFRAQTQNR